MKDFEVRPIPQEQTREWILKKHYAKRIPSISYSFGLYKGKELSGVCTFGSPPSNSLCIGICGKEYASQVVELNRLCTNSEPNGVLSYFVASCLRMLPKPKIVVSYADTSFGHHGYIYQATNWIYTGLSAKRTERFDINNPNMHSKSVTERKGVVYQDLAVRDRPQKHRYIYFLGSKKEVKNMRKLLKYKVCEYPKGENRFYDASYQPQTNAVLF